MARAVRLLTGLQLCRDLTALLCRRRRDLEHLPLRAAQTLEPYLARAVLHRADPHDLTEAAASHRTRHHVAGEVVLERVRRLERGRRAHHLVTRLATLDPARSPWYPEDARTAHLLQTRALPLLARLRLARLELGRALAALAGAARPGRLAGLSCTRSLRGPGGRVRLARAGLGDAADTGRGSRRLSAGSAVRRRFLSLPAPALRLAGLCSGSGCRLLRSRRFGRRGGCCRLRRRRGPLPCSGRAFGACCALRAAGGRVLRGRLLTGAGRRLRGT